MTFHLACSSAEQTSQTDPLPRPHFVPAALLPTEAGEGVQLRDIRTSNPWEEAGMTNRGRFSFKPVDSLLDTHFTHQSFPVLGFSGKAVEHFLFFFLSPAPSLRPGTVSPHQFVNK